MDNIRKFYGEELIKFDDFSSSEVSKQFKIEYYKLENDSKDLANRKFGIEVVKRNCSKNNEIIDKREIINLFDTEEKTEKLLEILQKNKVTPIGLNDVLEEVFLNKLKE